MISRPITKGESVECHTYHRALNILSRTCAYNFFKCKFDKPVGVFLTW